MYEQGVGSPSRDEKNFGKIKCLKSKTVGVVQSQTFVLCVMLVVELRKKLIVSDNSKYVHASLRTSRKFDLE